MDWVVCCIATDDCSRLSRGILARLVSVGCRNSTPAISALRSRTHIEKIAGYETVIILVLEKGAVSTFRVIHQRLKSEWRLDALQSPRTAALGSTGATSSIENRVVA